MASRALALRKRIQTRTDPGNTILRQAPPHEKIDILQGVSNTSGEIPVLRQFPEQQRPNGISIQESLPPDRVG